MSSSTYIPYYKKQIKQFNELAEFAESNGDTAKAEFNRSQAKMISGRMMEIKIQELKDVRV